MATKFLDKTGLSHFWSKIKAWCNATFAAITHSHAWSTITGKPTTISGYGITDAKIANGTITLGSNSITPLTSHQTLPTLSRTISGSGNAITDITVSGHAITATKGSTFLTSHQDISGKVNKSGDTMTGTLIIKPAGPGLKLCNNVVTKGTNPSSNTWTYLELLDNANGCLGWIGNSYNTSGVTTVGMYVRKQDATTENSIGVGYDVNKAAYTWAPTPATTDDSTKIATTAFVKAQGYITSSGSITGNAATVSGTAGTSLLAWNTENTVYTIGGHAIKVKLPANPNTDTHWTSHLYAGASNGNANAATTNGNTYLIICDNSTARDRRLIKGTGATTVTSDANGVITINSTDNNTTYSANNGVGLSGTTFYNSGVRSIATGSTNGTISVNTNGTAANVAVKGLGSAAYTASTAYAAASHSHSNYVDKSTDQTIGGVKTFSKSPLSDKNMWLLTDVAYTDTSAAAKYRSYYSGDKDATAQGRLMFYRNAKGAGVGAELQVCQYNSTSFNTIINGYLSTATGDTYRYVNIGSEYEVFRSNTQGTTKLGNSSFKWSQLYAATATISTSDEREKTEITFVPDNILDIWEGVDFCQYKMKDSVVKKGSENARIHNGAIAQSIDRLYKSYNIDISRYGLFCYDSWEKIEPTYDDVGGILNDGIEAGDSYSLRYEEVLCMEAAYQRRKNKILEERISELEERLAKLEGIM